MGTASGCVVAVVGDLHTNSTVGLCPHYVERYEGGYHTASKAQGWLRRHWQQFWTVAAATSDELKLPLVAIVNGDTFDGDHHGTHEIISRSEVTMRRIALGVLETPLKYADFVYIVRGTPSHDGDVGQRAEMIGESIGSVRAPDGCHSWWHMYADFGGVTFDIKHVPESNSRVPWGAGGDVNRIAVMMTLEYTRTGNKPPDIAFRSHIHGFRDSGRTHATQVFVLPPWQLRTSFAESIGVGGSVQSVGGIILACRDGSYAVDARIFNAPRDKPIKLPTKE
jgi:hypothetical protein